MRRLQARGSSAGGLRLPLRVPEIARALFGSLTRNA
jgi:hypothetical protein